MWPWIIRDNGEFIREKKNKTKLNKIKQKTKQNCQFIRENLISKKNLGSPMTKEVLMKNKGFIKSNLSRA